MQRQSQLVSMEAMAKQSAENAERIRRERDEALREVQHLRKLLKKKEEDCLTAEEELMKARRVSMLCGQIYFEPLFRSALSNSGKHCLKIRDRMYTAAFVNINSL